MKKRGQVWIETVTYTLVAFVMIGLVLAFARPKVEELQDQAIIDQSIQILKEIDSVIRDVSEKGVGNKRKIEITIKKGDLNIKSEDDILEFFIKSRYMYSQPDQEYEEGGLNILTIEKGKYHDVTLEKIYNEFNITFTRKEETKTLTKSSTPYVVYISNNGKNGGEKENINFEIK